RGERPLAEGHGNEQRDSSDPRHGTFTPTRLRGPAAARTFLARPTGHPVGFPFLNGERRRHDRRTGPPPHLQEKGRSHAQREDLPIPGGATLWRSEDRHVRILPPEEP